MKIAFVHYHLKTGGVTTVIRQQIDAIKDTCEVLVLTGEKPSPDFPARVRVIPELGYDLPGAAISDPGKTAEKIIDEISTTWPRGCDLVHVHNPFLAKNKNLLNILGNLQDQGIRLFLQIHDFAEDGRPHLYYPGEYPTNCHYGVINSRDYNILLNAGLEQKGLHKLFNMVNPFDGTRRDRGEKNVALYPVRAIRRKNIGEAILLSLFFKNHASLSITLPPNSPADMLSYQNWKKFVSSNRLNVEFEASLKSRFEDLVFTSKFLITTSITEGFGFSFLEPWTARKILWGRKLPDICSDFENNGISLSHLYSSLLVPVAWIGEKDLREKLRSSMLKNIKLFGLLPGDLDMENTFATLFKNDLVDFGLLDEAFQKKIILSVLSSGQNLKTLTVLNPFLADLDMSGMDQVIGQNRDAVYRHYSQERYRETLLSVYSMILKSEVSHMIDKKMLLMQFLNPHNFSLLKWSDYVE